MEKAAFSFHLATPPQARIAPRSAAHCSAPDCARSYAETRALGKRRVAHGGAYENPLNVREATYATRGSPHERCLHVSGLSLAHWHGAEERGAMRACGGVANANSSASNQPELA